MFTIHGRSWPEQSTNQSWSIVIPFPGRALNSQPHRTPLARMRVPWIDQLHEKSCHVSLRKLSELLRAFNPRISSWVLVVHATFLLNLYTNYITRWRHWQLHEFVSSLYTLARNCSQHGRCFTEFFRLYTTRTIITAVKFRRKLVVEARASWRTISGKPPDLASFPKSCNLLGWDLGYSEATDQVRWMRASPAAAAWLSRVPCAPVHCLVVTRRSRQTPAIWQ